jgi:hypothetical protein
MDLLEVQELHKLFQELALRGMGEHWSEPIEGR